MRFFFAFLLLVADASFADGSLSSDIRISSAALGYDLQYRVYIPGGVESAEELPALFITDGPAYIRHGRLPRILDRLISSARIEPVVAVFVDSRDPDDLSVDRRNQQFFCNVDYLRFYTDELIPAIEQAYPVRKRREARAILVGAFLKRRRNAAILTGFKEPLKTWIFS